MSRCWLACIVVATLAACWSSKSPHRTTPPVQLADDTPRVHEITEPVVREPRGIYALDEALADTFSSPWSFVGTGEWFGMFRVNACVYRNDRVYIVNIYCTLKEKPAFGLLVLSPTRGRVYIYAEGDKPISTTRRPDWFTFKAEANLPTESPLRLDFTYAELRAWDEARYKQNAPGCFGGVELRRPQKGCYKLEMADAWTARNQGFLAEPNDDWYRVVKEMRARVTKDARPYTGP